MISFLICKKNYRARGKFNTFVYSKDRFLCTKHNKFQRSTKFDKFRCMQVLCFSHQDRASIGGGRQRYAEIFGRFGAVPRVAGAVLSACRRGERRKTDVRRPGGERRRPGADPFGHALPETCAIASGAVGSRARYTSDGAGCCGGLAAGLSAFLGDFCKKCLQSIGVYGILFRLQRAVLCRARAKCAGVPWKSGMNAYIIGGIIHGSH